MQANKKRILEGYDPGLGKKTPDPEQRETDTTIVLNRRAV